MTLHELDEILRREGLGTMYVRTRPNAAIRVAWSLYLQPPSAHDEELLTPEPLVRYGIEILRATKLRVIHYTRLLNVSRWVWDRMCVTDPRTWWVHLPYIELQTYAGPPADRMLPFYLGWTPPGSVAAPDVRELLNPAPDVFFAWSQSHGYREAYRHAVDPIGPVPEPTPDLLALIAGGFQPAITDYLLETGVLSHE